MGTTSTLLRRLRPAWLLLPPLLGLVGTPVAAQTFSPVSTYQITQFGGNANAGGVAAGDVNGDGRKDIVVTRTGQQGLGVLLGQAGGGYAFSAEYATPGAITDDIVLHDVTGDGILDMVVATIGTTDVVKVFPGLGNGTFGTAVNYSAGTNSSNLSLTLADVTGDGRPDVLLPLVTEVGILPRLAAGGLGTVERYSTNTRGGEDVAVGDVNADGRPDLIIASNGGGGNFGPDVRVMLKRATAGYDAAIRLTTDVMYPTGTGNHPTSVGIADITRDGLPDVVVGNSLNTIGVIPNLGSGSFGAMTTYTVGGSGVFGTGQGRVTDLGLGDVNGDGLTDVVYSIEDLHSVGVRLGLAAGGLGNQTTLSTSPNSGPRNLILNDVNLDGRPDIVVGNYYTGTVGVLLNTTPILVPTLTSFSPGSGTVGSSISITGTNLGVASAVRFNGVSASFTINSATELTAIVPTGAPTGTISVTTPGGTATSSSSFVVTAPIPCAASVNVTASGPTTFSSGGSVVLTAQAVKPAFTTGTGFNSSAVATAVQADGKVLVAGSSTYNGTAIKNIVRLNQDGTIDPSFALTGTGFNGGVSNIAVQPDGKIVVAGSFTSYNGTARKLVARLNADGTLDPTFQETGTGIGGQIPSGAFSFGPGVNDLALQPDGKVLVAGAFSNYNGTSRVNLVRLNADGSLDTGFAPANTSFTDGANRVVVQPDGKILLAGTFRVVLGSPQSGTVVSRYNSNGTTDNTFQPVSSQNVDSNVEALAVQPDGKIILGGSLYGGGMTAFRYLDRRNADGSVDAGFTSSFNASVTELLVQPDGKILVGGRFSNYAGTTRGRIARINADGSLDTGFVPTGTGFNNSINSLSQQPDGKVVLTGSFTSYNGTTANRIARLNADGTLNDTATPIAGATYAWSNGQTGPSITVTQSGSYTATASYGNSCMATSEPTEVTVTFAAPTIAGFLPDNGPVASTFALGGTNLSGTTAVTINGTSATFSVVSASELSIIVPSGATTGLVSVTTPGGTATSTVPFTVTPNPVISTFNPTSGPVGTSVVITGQNFSGVQRVTFNQGTSTASFTIDSPTQITAIVPANGSTGPIGLNSGGLTSFSSTPFTVTVAVPVISSFNPTSGPVGTNVVLTGSNLSGATAVAFNGTNAPGFVVNSPTQITVSVPAGATSGAITVTTPGGTATSATLFGVLAQSPVVARLNPAGPLSACTPQTLTATAVNPGFNVGGSGLQFLNNGVYDIALQPDGKILLAGFFSGYNGTGSLRSLMRLNADGSIDNTFNVGGTGFNTRVWSIALQSDGKIIAGGSFNSYNNTTVPYGLIRLNADGTWDNTFSAVVPGEIKAVAVQADGKVLASTEQGNASMRDMMRFNADGSRDQAFYANIGTGFQINGSGGIRDIVVQPDGKILVANRYGFFNGQPVATGLSRLNADGTLDTTFNPGGGGADGAGSPDVRQIALLPNGKILISGGFSTYNGTSSVGLARVNANGTVDNSFNVGNGFSNGPGSFNWEVFSVAALPDGKVLAGGRFTWFNNSAAAPDKLVRLNVDGSLDTSFNPGGAGFGATLNHIVYALQVQPDGKILTGGSFDGYNGNAALPDGVLRLTTNGLPNDTDTALNGATFTFSPGGSTTNPLVTSTPGQYTVTATVGGVTSAPSNVVTLQACASTDLVVNTTQTVSGSYNNVTITGTGVATLNGALTVTGTLLVETGGQLLTNCQPITSSGSFSLQAGATLGICDANGIAASGSTGAVQLSGTRSFSSDASYLYNGTAAQVTGSGLPAQVRNLTITNANAVTLSQPVSIRQVLTLGSTGNLNLNGQDLTLLSDASGTALIVNAGSGTVNGTATVQRYISPSLNPGAGYRHFSAPVANAPVSQLGTSGDPVVVNAAYNGSATPGTVTPFPTVFAYQQLLVSRSTNNLDAFDKGWFSPMSLGEMMQIGQGYTFQVGANRTVSFSGTPTSGDRTLSLDRNAAGTLNAATAGWQLVGNPYPAPLDWSQVAAADRAGLTGAMYVFESRDPYTGDYRTFTNGIGGGSPLIASGQGFFVRVAPTQTSATLTFRNAQRVTSYGQQSTFRRSTPDTRPQLRLQLQSGTSSDAVYVYVEAGASTGLDLGFDAEKLRNTTGLNLAATASTGQSLAIQGLDQLGNTMTVVPLTVQVPQAGSYTLAVGELLHFLPGTSVSLRDELLGTSTMLTSSTRYSFQSTGTSANGRFYLELRSTGALATASQVLAQQVSLYPNPAQGRFQVLLPASATAAQLTLLNSLGQPVRTLKATGTSTTVDVTGLAKGVYTLRVQAGSATVTKRIVLD